MADGAWLPVKFAECLVALSERVETRDATLDNMLPHGGRYAVIFTPNVFVGRCVICGT